MDRKVMISYIVDLISLFFITVSLSSIVPLIPQLLIFFHWSSTVYGLMISLSSFSSFIGLLICGKLSDKYGRKNVLYVTLIGSSICALWTGLSRTTTFFLVSRLIGGIFDGSVLVFKAHIADITTVQERARYLAMSSGVMSVGSVVAPSIGSLFGKTLLFAPFYFNCASSLFILLMTIFILQDSRVIKSQLQNTHNDNDVQINVPLMSNAEDETSTREIPKLERNRAANPKLDEDDKSGSLSHLLAQGNSSLSHILSESALSKGTGSYGSFYSTSDMVFTPQSDIIDEYLIPKETDKSLVFLICVSIFITWSSYSFFLSIFNLWITETFNASTMTSGVIFTISSVFGVITTFIIYPLLNRFTFNSTIFIFGSIIQSFCWGMVAISQKKLLTYIFSVASAIGNSLTSIVPHFLITMISSPDRQGANLSYTLSSDSLGRTVFPLLYSIIYGYSKIIPFWMCAGCALLNVPFGIYLRSRIKKYEIEILSNHTRLPK